MYVLADLLCVRYSSIHTGVKVGNEVISVGCQLSRGRLNKAGGFTAGGCQGVLEINIDSLAKER